MAKKPQFSSIPAPVADVNSLLRTVEALRMNVELLTRQRGGEESWPMTVGEMRQLNILDESRSLPHAPVGKPAS